MTPLDMLNEILESPRLPWCVMGESAPRTLRFHFLGRLPPAIVAMVYAEIVDTLAPLTRAGVRIEVTFRGRS